MSARGLVGNGGNGPTATAKQTVVAAVGLVVCAFEGW